MWKWWKKDYPQFYQTYLDKFDESVNSSMICSLDLETTSLDVKNAEILSLGIIDLKEHRIRIESQKEWFFRSEHVDEENTKVHELFSYTDGEEFQERLPEILDIIGNKVILGHFVEFDIQMLNAALKRVGAGKLKNKSVDTLQMALRHDGVHDFSFVNKEDYTLYALCQRFGIEVTESHQALTDAYLTALLYLHLQEN